MNFGAMLSGVAPGFQKMEQVQIGQESNRIREDELAMQAENQRATMMRELVGQGMSVVDETINAALEQGIVDPAKLSKSLAPVIQQLGQLDPAAAQQATARVNALAAQGSGAAAGPGPVPDWWPELSKGQSYATQVDPNTGKRTFVTDDEGYPTIETRGKALPGEQAAKTGLILGSLEGSETWIPELLSEPEGLAQNAGQIIDYFTSGTPIATNLGGKAVAYKKAAQLAEANARALTGAAMPDTETARFASFFTPSPGEDITIQRAKLEASVDFAKNYLADVYKGRDQIDPNDKAQLAKAKEAFKRYKADNPDKARLIESAEPVDTSMFLKDPAAPKEFKNRSEGLAHDARVVRKMMREDPNKKSYLIQKLRENGWTDDELDTYGFAD